jgi:L-ascorbate metabolism protein UlaG (beta-lactamase superfamily)
VAEYTIEGIMQLKKKYKIASIIFISVVCAMAMTQIEYAIENNPALENRLAEILKKTEWLKSSHAYGSACIRITHGKVIYIDPSCLSSEQTKVKADLILVTHSHDDHFSIKTLQELYKDSTTIVTVKDCHEKLTKASTGFKILKLSPGDKINVDDFAIEAVPAYNLESSAHPRSQGWAGFIITIDGVRVYHSGDTSFTPEMKELDNIDIALLTVRDHYMMNGKQVVEAITSFKPKVVIPIHWLAPEKPEIQYIEETTPPDTKVVLLDSL